MKKINIIIAISAVLVVFFGFVNTKSPSTKQLRTQSAVIGVQVGDVAPELKFNNPQGEAISLSSLRGKIVLIDFWASWCGPCRQENPNIVATYQKYNKFNFSKTAQGFTVYSVSLDQSQPSWVNAIAKDGLIWKNHVSDLGGWNSAGARNYGINSIPSGFLLNEHGVIIAKGNTIRGAGLEAELKKLIILNK